MKRIAFALLVLAALFGTGLTVTTLTTTPAAACGDGCS